MNKRICPKCQSENLKHWTSNRFEEVGWSDGLGSPGQLCFTDDHYKCKDCDHAWTE